jgi:GNAT superfamily N-acetyltransferase
MRLNNLTPKDAETCPGNNLSNEVIEACANIIRQGGAVDPKSAKRELPLAEMVAIVRAGQEVVAAGAIKRQRPKYAADIAQKSGISFDRNMLELGYVSVEKSYHSQGLSHRIVTSLLTALPDRSLFATTSSERMKDTLAKAGFVLEGSEWQGNKSRLSLWIKKGESG